jgi:hypothetical protein
VVVLALALAAFTWNREAVFFGGEVFFADGDCYARMTRVRMIEEGGLRAISHHTWENFPDGTTPHTTMPLDALIAGLSAGLRIFSERHLALAGAWVSPLLGAGLLVFLAMWSAVLRLPYRRTMVLVVVASPILAHGFQVGRPDHQSLLLVLAGVALAAEVAIWNGAGRQASCRWRYVGAVAWGLALWVSLFEPVILLGLVLLARAGRRLLGAKAEPTHSLETPACRFGPGGVFALLLLLAWMVDGWRVAGFDPAFERWAMNIGELRPAGWAGIFSWCGWLAVVAPGFLVWRLARRGERVAGLWIVLLLVMLGLTFYHARWGYFLALVFAMSLPWALPALRWPVLACGVVVVAFWPVAAEWERILYPDEQAFLAQAEKVADAVALREAALELRGQPLGGVVAPWWFCPAVVWWSGFPCIGGTSHQSLPGITDSSVLYLAEDAAAVEPMLVRRGVKYVIAYEPERVVANAEQILGVRAGEVTLAEVLYKHPRETPRGWKLIFANRFFKVYQVVSQACGEGLNAPPVRAKGSLSRMILETRGRNL